MKVHFFPSGKQVEAQDGMTLFDAAQAVDLPVGSSCGADGTCGKCGLRVLSGSLPPPSEREQRILQDNRLDSNVRLSCMVKIHADVEVTADYW
ncbi:MAG: 2Fe-2S iron-sulfur cluster-binding protein [Myxococcota bacterium]